MAKLFVSHSFSFIAIRFGFQNIEENEIAREVSITLGNALVAKNN